ncbi:MAG: pseudouridine synthase [Bacteroidetes bacterium]|nr:pseudouridine synthase [Bacteroidota bacterium]
MSTFLFYKPFEVLSQFSDSENKKTLADFLKKLPRDIYPAGRLDYDSEGLIVLTSDKKLAFQLTNPSFGHERCYFVQVEGLISEEALQQLSSGLNIRVDGKLYHTRPAKAIRCTHLPSFAPRIPPIRFRKSIPDSWLSLTLTEGRNRQVRRMTAAVGFPTLRLLRYSIGAISIEGMMPGDFVKADAQMIQDLLKKSSR